MDLLTHRNTGRMSGLLPVSDDLLRLDSKHEAGGGRTRHPERWSRTRTIRQWLSHQLPPPINPKFIFPFLQCPSRPIPHGNFHNLPHVTL